MWEGQLEIRPKTFESLVLEDPGNYNDRIHVRKDKTHPRRLGFLTLLLFASPPEWPWLATGALLIAAGISLHGWTAGYLARAGYAEREKILTVRGPYRHSRNPSYVAQMIMDLGFFILAGRPLLYAVYFPVIFLVYRRWVANEETFLEREFGDSYRTLKREVPRWRFRITPAPARGDELKFQWKTFRINRELPRSISHIVLFGTFVFFFFLGNPFESISTLFRVTLIVAIAVWLMLRDIYALDVSQKSVGWIIVASCSAAGALLFLISAPVWRPGTGVGAWMSIGAGLCLALLGWAAALPDRAGFSSKNNRPVFARPITHWYVLALGFGLLSCTLGGIWLAIMTSFTLWSFHLAGVSVVPRVPRRPSVSFALLLLIVGSGGLSVASQIR
jgi:hypothetical protein